MGRQAKFAPPWVVKERYPGQWYAVDDSRGKRLAEYIPEPAVAELMANAPRMYELIERLHRAMRRAAGHSAHRLPEDLVVQIAALKQEASALLDEFRPEDEGDDDDG